jgi:hypothetical protein
MIEEWESDEETEEEKNLSQYHKKIKEIKVSDEDYKTIMSFDSNIMNSYRFVSVINSLGDKDLIQMCTKMYPNSFVINDDTLKVKDFNVSDSFTQDQKTACNKFMEFMCHPLRKTFGLYGFSGTGKTTSIIEIASYLIKMKLIKSAAFTAPTNKAVNVMKNKFDKCIRDIYYIYSGKKTDEEMAFDDIIFKLHDFNVNIQFSTIHKLLNFEFDFDNQGKLIFVKTTDNEIWKFGFIVIDECSMLPAQMVHHIFNDIRGDARQIKIVFSGDTAQLPPVNERNSIIFSNSHNDFTFNDFLKCMDYKDKEGNDLFNQIQKSSLERKYKSLMEDIISMNNYVMEQVVRSKSPNVVGACTTIRNWTIGRTNTYNIRKYVGCDCKAYKYESGTSKIKSEWFKVFLRNCKAGSENIILTWTNRQCNEYNNAARKCIFGTDKLDRFQVGDTLMLNDFYNMKEHEEDEKNKFYTSEQIKVIDIDIGPVELGRFQNNISKKVQRLEHSKVYEAQYKKMIENIYAKVKTSFKCWKLKVKRLSSNLNDASILYVIHEDDEEIYKKDYEFVNNSIRGLRNTLVSKFREKIQVIETNVIKQLWKDAYSIYVTPFGEVNYSYSSTTHKSQGSSFRNVFVDVNDILANPNTAEMKKCLYTALSRTSNELHMLI